MLVNTLVFNPLISFVMLHKNPYPLLFTCLKESGLQAFFTRSSAANIPINMSLCKKLELDEDFYSVKDDGSCWLEQLGRKIIIQSLNDYMEEVITVNGVQRSRMTQIQMYAQELAQRFKTIDN